MSVLRQNCGPSGIRRRRILISRVQDAGVEEGHVAQKVEDDDHEEDNQESMATRAFGALLMARAIMTTSLLLDVERWPRWQIRRLDRHHFRVPITCSYVEELSTAVAQGE